MEDYAQLEGEELNDIANVIRRIIEQRNDDITENDALVEAVNFNGLNRTDVQEEVATAEFGSNTFHLDVDATAGVATATLPASPISNRLASIAKADVSANAVTVDGNGKNINGSATISLASQYDNALLIFIGGADEWRRLI